MTRRRVSAWGVVVIMTGCSSGQMMPAMDAGSDSGTPMPSTLSASGALSGMISAPKPLVGYDATGNAGSFTLNKTSGAGLPFKAEITLGFTGMPSASTTYTSSSPGFTCNVRVTSGAAAADTWVALYNQPPQANKGACSLTLSSAAVGAAGYDVTGTLTLTADNSGGASTGMVNLSGSF
jgi:hypothetical protein